MQVQSYQYVFMTEQNEQGKSNSRWLQRDKQRLGHMELQRTIFYILGE